MPKSSKTEFPQLSGHKISLNILPKENMKLITFEQRYNIS